MNGILIKMDDNIPKIKEFRQRLSDVLKPHHDNSFLLRFLRARKFDIDKAEAMIRKSLLWRKSIGADYMKSTYKIPEVVEKYFPSALLGFDKGGSTVRLLPQGTVDYKGLVSAVKRPDIMRLLVYMFEYDLEQMKENNKKTGKNANTFVFIVDYEYFAIKNVLSKPVMESLFEGLRIFEANYPERLKAGFLINVPPMFSLLYAAMKPFLAEETQAKMKIFGSDGWKEDILKIIDSDVVPACYGGTRLDENGDPKCSTLYSPGGSIPISYYLQQRQHLADNPNAVQIKIHHKSEHLVKIDVEKISFLEWEVQTEDIDISIGLQYRCTEDETFEEIRPSQKYTCQLVAESGSHVCETAGHYILILKNDSGKSHQTAVVNYLTKLTFIEDKQTVRNEIVL